MNDKIVRELLDLNQRLLDSIAAGDWNAYQELCNADLTCFEPESQGHLVAGLEFHKFYFDLGAAAGPRNTTMVSPQVRLLDNDAALVTYVRLVQKLEASGAPVTVACQETRVWQRLDGRWRHVHFHRS